jgi:hypothetical protein
MSVGNPIEVSGREVRDRESVTRTARDEVTALRAEAQTAVSSARSSRADS